MPCTDGARESETVSDFGLVLLEQEDGMTNIGSGNGNGVWSRDGEARRAVDSRFVRNPTVCGRRVNSCARFSA